MYEYQPQGPQLTAYHYNAQAVEDHELLREAIDTGKQQPPPPRAGTYRPTPLRWPFIVCQIVFLCGAIGLIVYAHVSMPASQSTAHIQARQLMERSDGNSSSALSPLLSSTTPPSLSIPKESRPSTVAALSSGLDIGNLALGTSGVVSNAVTPSPSSTSTEPGPKSTATIPPLTIVVLVDSSSSSKQVPSTQATTQLQTSNSPSSPTNTRGNADLKDPTPLISPAQNHAASSMASTSVASVSDGSSRGPISDSPPSTAKNVPLMESSSRPSSQTVAPITTSGAFRQKGGQEDPTTANKDSVSTTKANMGMQADSSSTPSSASKYIPLYTTINSKLVSVSIRFSNTPITTGTSFTTRTVTSTGTTTKPTTKTTIFSSSLPGSTFTGTFSTTRTLTLTMTSTSVGTSDGTTFTSTQYSPTVTTTVVTFTSTGTIPGSMTYGTSTVVGDETSVFTTTATNTESKEFIGYGQVEITSYYTVDLPAEKQQPITQVYTNVEGGETMLMIATDAPQTQVVDQGQQVHSEVVDIPPQTIVQKVGGTPTTMVIVITPSPENQAITVGGGVTNIGGIPVTIHAQDPQSFVTTVDGTPVTVVRQGPQTVVTNVGGTLQTILSTPPARTFETVVDGTTRTVVTQPPPETVVTMIGGKPTTIVRPPPDSYVTTIGGTVMTVNGMTVESGRFKPLSWTVVSTIDGTLTTMVVQTSPTGREPISYTITTTVGESLSTWVSSGVPTTIVTTISGRLTTMTSTPTPRTFTTTRPKSTLLSTSVSTPSATPNSNSTVVASTKTYNLQPWDYFLGTFLPTFLAVMLVIPLRVIDLNAKLYQPFHALTRPGGASGKDSLNLQYTGIAGFITPVLTLAEGQPVPFFTTLIVLSSSLMAPLATEALSLKVHGNCTLQSATGCALALGVSVAPAFALIGIICLVIGLLITLLFLLRRWETGVYANPWNIAGIAALAGSPDVRLLQTTEAKMKSAVANKTYSLGYFENHNRHEEYGIVLSDESGSSLQQETDDLYSHEQEFDGPADGGMTAAGRRVPFMALTHTWRILFILFLLSLLSFVLYYHLTLGQSSPFKLFISTNSFGVRFFFAGLGVLITFFWTHFFISVATMVPYQAMLARSQPPERSILVTRPTNEFYGIFAAVKQRQPYLFVAALMTIFSEFLPILLSNIPYSVTQVEISSVICARITIVILCLMLLTLFASFVIHWPRLPVDPRTIAGAMFYVTDSYMLAAFEGVSLLDRRDKDARVREMGRRYYFGDIIGRSGQARVGVDSDVSLTNAVDTAYRGYQMDHQQQNQAGLAPTVQYRGYQDEGPAGAGL